MSENLSSKNFFHFTPKETLKKILKNRFYALYSEEEIFKTAFDKDEESNQFIPMVSFCNIPLSLINKHCLEYHQYGIGLTDKWVKANKINPVLYSYRDSTLMNFFYESQLQGESFFNTKVDEHKKILNEYKDIFKIFNDTLKKPLLFLKPDEGISLKTKEWRHFYDEKEWRYVPTLPNMYDTTISKKQMEKGYPYGLYFIVNEAKNYITDINELNKTILDNSLKHFESYKLHFELDDIEFIILKSNSEIIEMIEYIIETFKNEKSDDISDELKVLISKIITLEQLTNDF